MVVDVGVQVAHEEDLVGGGIFSDTHDFSTGLASIYLRCSEDSI